MAPAGAAPPGQAGEEVGDLEAVARAAGLAPPEPPQRNIVIVMGPAMSEPSSQARLVAERYQVPLTTLDALLLVSFHAPSCHASHVM